jgi:hypothetical protein
MSTTRRLSALLALVLGLVSCLPGDVDLIDMSFPDYDGAIAAARAGNLWVPSVFPTSANKIRVLYDIDTGETLVSWKCDSGLNVGLAKLSAAEPEKLGAALPHRVSVDWWPRALRASAPLESVMDRYRILWNERRIRSRNGLVLVTDEYFAISEADNSVYYWRTAATGRGQD